MTAPAAILSVGVSADTLEAASKLTKFDAQLKAVQGVAEKGIQARLGATLDPAAFRAYQDRLSQAASRARDRAAFKAELGANFNNSAFNAYERALQQARGQSEAFAREQQAQAARLRASLRQGVSNFFTGSKMGEERSFARGTLRGAVGRGAGFLGGGLAGGLLGYVSAQGITNAVEGTTQLVKVSQNLAHFTGMSAQSALEFESVAKALGTSTSGVATGFRTLATATNNALLNPTKASVKAFQELGLSHADLKAHSKDLGALFGIVSDRLNQLPKGAERTALAAKLLGRNWQQLAPLIQAGSQGMKDQEAQAKALGVTLGGNAAKNIEKLHQAEINLKLAQEGLSIGFTEHVAPALVKVMTGAIKLAETVGHDLTPVFHDLGPVVRDAGHWLSQNRDVVRDLVLGLAGLKILRTVGGWFGGLYNDARSTVTVMQAVSSLVTGQGGAWERLTGVFRGQQTETQALAGSMNELAASMERVTLAQRGVAGSTVAADAALGTEATIAAGAGAAAAGGVTGRVGAVLGAGGYGLAASPAAEAGGVGASAVIPGAAAAYMLFHALTTKSQTYGPRGLASLLGPTSEWGINVANPAGMHMSQNAGDLLSSFNPLGGHFLETKMVANTTAASAGLKQLRNGLKNVTDATELTNAQLRSYGQVVQRLRQMPDLTAKQRNGLKQLAHDLNPTTVAFRRATAQWSATFAGFDATTGNVSRHFRDQLVQDSQSIDRNWTRGTKHWTTQMTALTSAAWQQVQQMSDDGVKGVGQDIVALLAMIDQAQIAATNAGRNWLGAVQGNLASLGLGKALAAAHGHLPGGGGGNLGYNVPSHHAAHHAAAQHMYYDPFTGAYEMMTGTEYRRLRDRYIAQYGSSPPSGPHLPRAPRGTRTTTGSSAAGSSTFTAPGQSQSLQIQFQQLANELQTAQNAQNLAAQQSILNREVRLDKRAIGLDDRKLAQITRQLKGSISRARRNQLTADKLALLQDIGTLRGNIGSALANLQSLTSSSSSGTFDLAPAGSSIVTPTIYDVRRAASRERQILRREHHHHGTTNITVNVSRDADIGKVADALDRAMGSRVRASLRAAGMRGT